MFLPGGMSVAFAGDKEILGVTFPGEKDMAPGLTTESTYIPGKGLIYTYQGVTKGTIPGSEFMKLKAVSG